MQARIIICTKTREVRLPFKRMVHKYSDQFIEVLLFLYWMRRQSEDGEGWTRVEDFRRLPRYSTSPDVSLRKIISRHIHRLNDHKLPLITYKSKITIGPYRLSVNWEEVELDIADHDIEERLQLTKLAFPNLSQLREVVPIIVDADHAYHMGHLANTGDESDDSALGILNSALDTFKPVQLLRLLLSLRRFDVLERLGDYQDAKKLAEWIMEAVEENQLGPDTHPLFKCRSSILRAWMYYRQGSVEHAEICLQEIKWDEWNCRDDVSYAEFCAIKGIILREKALSGLRRGMRPDELEQLEDKSLEYLKRSLYFSMRAANYDGIQIACFNIGNTLYRFGNESVVDQFNFKHGDDAEEIKEWLYLSDRVCETFNVGGNSVLNKIVLSSLLWRREKKYEEAEQLTRSLLPKLDRIRNHYEMGLVHQQLVKCCLYRGNKDEALQHRTKALHLFERIGDSSSIKRLHVDSPNERFK